MKITGVSFHKVNFPLEAPMLWSAGKCNAWTRIIVRMRTDEGLEGIAEAPGAEATLVQLHTLKDFYLGEDPFDREKILKNFWYVATYHGASGKYAIEALETCCFDIMGKATGRPLCQLLAGKLRAHIPSIAYIYYREHGDDGRGGERTAEEIVERIRRLVDEYGMQTIKLKGGVYSPEDEYETTAAVRAAFPAHQLRFDPNSLWSVETAITMGRRFEELNLEFYEDPVWGIEGMSRVAQKVNIALATNMCCVNLDQLPLVIRTGAIAIQLLDVHDWGGITATMKAAATCQVFGIGMGIHSGGEGGISTALNLHIAAALPVLPHAIDSHYHDQTEDVITQPHRYVDGGFLVPDGPGLGVEIDEDQLARLEEVNRRQGDDHIFYGESTWRVDPPYMGMW